MDEEQDIGTSAGVRIGVDVGGTFTKAVAVYTHPLELVAQVVVPTTHDAPQGVALGVVQALEQLLAHPFVCRFQPRVVAHSTTQAVNALLEGDTATVGIIGMGAGLTRRESAKRTNIGDITLAPGRLLHTLHRFVETDAGLLPQHIEQAVGDLQAAGAGAIVASEAFGVDDEANEKLVLDTARRHGLPATAGHEVSGAYGLEVRTLTAAINASIMPKMLQTANLVEGVLLEAGVRAPLVVMRGDGGVMSMDQLRARPLLTVLSGPAASLAGALLYGQVLDGIFLEVGGTSTNLGIIQGGQPVMKYVQIMNHPTSMRSLDVRVQGVAGGSMARLRGRKLHDVGPRSAHIAGLPYACYTPLERLKGPLTLELFAAKPGDPADYVAVRCADGGRVALTVTCAANALGEVAAGVYASASQEAALLAFAPLGQALGVSAEDAARRLLDLASGRIAEAVDALVAEYHLDKRQLTLVGGGGGAGALGPAVARRVGAGWRLAEHAEVISSIGVALAMVREEVERTLDGAGPDEITRLAKLVETRAIASGADPRSIQVMTEAVPEKGGIRAVAIGSVALDIRHHDGRQVDAIEARHIAARRVRTKADHLTLAGKTAQYYVFGPPARRIWPWQRSLPVVVVDGRGVVRLEADGAQVMTGPPSCVTTELRIALGDGKGDGPFGLGPRVYLLTDHDLLDFSALSKAADSLAAAERALDVPDTGAHVVAVVQRPKLL